MCVMLQPTGIDLERTKPGRHVGYGSGIHHCLGAPLARRELFWAFQALIDRVEDIRFADNKNSFEVAPNFSLRAMKALHLEFTALPPERRVDPADVDAESNATEIDNPANN